MILKIILRYIKINLLGILHVSKSKINYSRLLKYIIFNLIAMPVYADNYHNINGFFGERATGLGGAYSGVSDDPAGAYYNPAGLAYAYDNSISLSASNLTRTKKVYENVIGPGQGYGRNSQNYTPNFFGLVRSAGSGKIGFSIVNPVNDTFQRNDQIQSPLYYTDISNLKTTIENLTIYLNVGLSYAEPINSKLSWGTTVYFTSDTASTTSTQMLQLKDKSYITNTLNDNRRTLGVMPIIGLMYTPTDKISFGASVRHQFVTAGNRLINTFDAGSAAVSTDNITFVEGTNQAYGGIRGNTIFKGPAPTGKVPEITEIRSGFAFFPNRTIMAAFDAIYTSGFSHKQSNTELIYSPGSTTIAFTDSENLELKRYSTLNFAGGTEIYITEFMSIRLGGYTNFANSKPLSWTNTALSAANKNLGDTETIYNENNLAVNYKVSGLRENPRNEYVNNIGYCFGFSFSTAKASIGINIIKEVGRGVSQIDSTRPLQSMTYDSSSVYVIVSSRNN
jgi:hypothetical protein